MNKIETGRTRRAMRIRKKIVGTSGRPRLSVFRSNQHVSVQLIDDTAHKTLLGLMEEKGIGTKTDIARAMGVALAKKALEMKIQTVIFDKGAYAYHGRVKAVAEGAREGGLKF